MADDQIPLGESARVRNTTIIKPIVYGNISYPFPKKRETGHQTYLLNLPKKMLNLLVLVLRWSHSRVVGISQAV